MKLNKILGAAVVAGIFVLSASSVFAADDSFTLGAPVVATTGEAVTEYTNGQVIAVPYDITTTTNGLTSYKLAVSYDSDVVTPGATFSLPAAVAKNQLATGLAHGTATAVYTDVSNESLFLAVGTTGGVWYADYGVYDLPTATYTAHAVTEDKNVNFVMAATSSIAVNDEHEGYLLFTVKDASAFTDKLNVSIATVIESESTVGDNKHDKPSTTDIPSTSEKVNACAGAFNIKIDATKLTSYVQALYVQIGDAEAVSVPYYTVDGDIYKFPVRVLTTKDDASVDVKVLADTSSDLDGKNDAKSKVSLGTITVTLNSPSDYADSTIS